MIERLAERVRERVSERCDATNDMNMTRDLSLRQGDHIPCDDNTLFLSIHSMIIDTTLFLSIHSLIIDTTLSLSVPSMIIDTTLFLSVHSMIIDTTLFLSVPSMKSIHAPALLLLQRFCPLCSLLLLLLMNFRGSFRIGVRLLDHRSFLVIGLHVTCDITRME